MALNPVSRGSRPAECIPLINYAIVDEIPEALSLRDHMVMYEGMGKLDDLVWGLYGTLSANQGLFLAEGYATRQNKRMVTIELRYHLDNFAIVRSMIDRTMAEASGFLHLDRVKMNFRDEVQDCLLAGLGSVKGERQRAMYADKSAAEIILREPWLVRSLFEGFPKINMIVHPVRQLWDPEETRPLHVASARLIKSRLVEAGVRYLPHIKVTP